MKIYNVYDFLNKNQFISTKCKHNVEETNHRNILVSRHDCHLPAPSVSVISVLSRRRCTYTAV